MGRGRMVVTALRVDEECLRRIRALSATAGLSQQWLMRRAVGEFSDLRELEPFVL